MEAAAPAPRVIPTFEIDIDAPNGWTVERDLGPFAVMARPMAWPNLPRPVVNVLTIPFEGDSIDEYVDIQLRDLRSTLGGVRLLQLDVSGGSPPELRLLAAFEGMGADLTCYQRQLLWVGTRAVVVTATATDQDWPEVVEPMLRAVHSVRTG